MAKLIYVYGDDSALLDTLTSSLSGNGYSLEFVDVNDRDVPPYATADITLICKTATQADRLTMGGVTLDFNDFSVWSGGRRLHFTSTEFALLSYLLKNASRAVPRSELLTEVWHYDAASGTRVADDTVKRLRKKLVDTGLAIETVWGYGFKICEK